MTFHWGSKSCVWNQNPHTKKWFTKKKLCFDEIHNIKFLLNVVLQRLKKELIIRHAGIWSTLFICWCSRHNKMYCHESFCSIARSRSWMSRKSNFLKCFNPAHSLIRIPFCKVICNLLYSTLVSYQIIF